MNISSTKVRSKVTVTTSLGDYVSLFKPKIIALLTITSITSAIVASGGSIPWFRIAILFVAGVLAAAGSACFNNYFDRDIDAVMRRTMTRPLPSDRISGTTALLLGLVLSTVALLLSTRLNYWVTLYVMAGSFVYVFVYTIWLKRRSWLNIIIGGTAGSFAVLGGWAAVRPELSVIPLTMALVVFLWTPHHFWSFALVYKEDYGRARLPMLPVVVSDAKTSNYILCSTFPLVVTTLIPYLFGALGPLYLAFAVMSGGLLLASAVALNRRPSKEIAWHNFKISGLYLAVLFAAMLVDALI